MGKVVVFEPLWLYSGRSSCIREKVVLFELSGCIRAKVVDFGKKLLYSCKVNVFWKVDVFRQKCCIFSNVV